MIVVEYSPDKTLTGILRTTLKVIRALSSYSDVYLLMGLNFPHYKISKTCTVKLIRRNSINSIFDDELLEEIEKIHDFEVPLSLIEEHTIFYPRWRPKKRYFRKEVGIIYDCSPLVRSGDFIDAGASFFKAHLKTSSRMNSLTITISDFTKREINSFVPFSQGTLIRVYPGPSFSPLKLRQDTSLIAPNRRDPYCLFVGSLDPRKGILELLSWWGANYKDSKFQKLILAGSIPTWAPEDFKAKLVDTLVNTPKIEHLGRLSDSEVYKLLIGAGLCFYPSKYEGFGLPACDALFAGIPLVTSERTSTAEFVEAGAVVINPEKPWTWSKLIENSTSKPFSIDSLMQKYNWDNFAIEITQL
jgi:glycosyltransferase involved in cell wall biosynthesis